MPGTFWPFMFTGILWIKMPACGFRGAGFAIFGGWLAASFGMNMEAMFTGGSCFQIGRKLQTVSGFSNGDATN